MRRNAWFEIHDHPLFPGFLRDLVTDALEAMWNALDTYGPVTRRLERALAESGATRVVDLCSGGGGPWLRLSRDLTCVDAAPAPAILLTDKYPNRRAIEQIQKTEGTALRFYSEPVDATHIPADLAGFRTMFSTFHHFGPGTAKAILQDAFDQRQGIAIFEAAKCDVRTLAVVFAVPFIALRLAPRIRPFRWSQIFWTYCVPMIPFTLWLDGILSCLRSYSQADLEELISGMASDDYIWEIGEEDGGPIPITYLVGCPVGGAEHRREELAEMQRPA